MRYSRRSGVPPAAGRLCMYGVTSVTGSVLFRSARAKGGGGISISPRPSGICCSGTFAHRRCPFGIPNPLKTTRGKPLDPRRSHRHINPASTPAMPTVEAGLMLSSRETGYPAPLVVVLTRNRSFRSLAACPHDQLVRNGQDRSLRREGVGSFHSRQGKIHLGQWVKRTLLCLRGVECSPAYGRERS